MKKLNRKGFTLIELMVVIAILIVIMGIALPNITSSIERWKEKQMEHKKSLVESAAKLYFDKNPSKNPTVGVSVSTIITDQQVPGVSATDVCATGKPKCCVKYVKNSETEVFEFKVMSDDESC